MSIGKYNNGDVQTMKILVPIKRVVDPYVKIRVDAAKGEVDTSNAKMSMNPFDEIAVEEAIRLKESGTAETVTVVSIGEEKSQETLRTALAMGADTAIHVQSSLNLEPLMVAKALKVIVEEEKPQLVILGKQAIDGDNNQVGQMLAGLLGWGQATFASKITVNGNNIEVVREIDGGLETVALTCPAVITTDLRLNEPRYVALPNIMKARSKPLSTKNLEDLGLDLKPRLNILSVEEPSKRKAGIKVESVDALLDKLKNEAGVL